MSSADHQNKKIIKFNKGVEQTSIEKDDGSIKVVDGSYTIHLESGGITVLFGVSLTTARECKRISDKGFTETEIRRIRNNGPFSIDPDVDCERLMLQFNAQDEAAINNIQEYLQMLLDDISLRKKTRPKDDPYNRNNLLRLIFKSAEQIRMPKNLDLAEELMQLKLCGSKREDMKSLASLIDKMKARNIKKYPS